MLKIHSMRFKVTGTYKKECMTHNTAAIDKRPVRFSPASGVDLPDWVHYHHWFELAYG